MYCCSVPPRTKPAWWWRRLVPSCVGILLWFCAQGFCSRRGSGWATGCQLRRDLLLPKAVLLPASAASTLHSPSGLNTWGCHGGTLWTMVRLFCCAVERPSRFSRPLCSQHSTVTNQSNGPPSPPVSAQRMVSACLFLASKVEEVSPYITCSDLPLFTRHLHDHKLSNGNGAARTGLIAHLSALYTVHLRAAASKWLPGCGSRACHMSRPPVPACHDYICSRTSRPPASACCHYHHCTPRLHTLPRRHQCVPTTCSTPSGTFRGMAPAQTSAPLSRPWRHRRSQQPQRAQRRPRLLHRIQGGMRRHQHKRRQGPRQQRGRHLARHLP